jgi:hypothetical protein
MSAYVPPDDELSRLGGVMETDHAVLRTYWFDGGVFIMDVVGKLDNVSLSVAIDALYRDPRTLRPHAVVFREGPNADYDRSVLTFYQTDRPRPMPVLVGVIAKRTMVRVVAAATGIGFRALTKTRFNVYEDTIGALVDARSAVSGAAARAGR